MKKILLFAVLAAIIILTGCTASEEPEPYEVNDVIIEISITPIVIEENVIMETVITETVLKENNIY